jgi:hypothetical protein
MNHEIRTELFQLLLFRKIPDRTDQSQIPPFSELAYRRASGIEFGPRQNDPFYPVQRQCEHADRPAE